MSNMNWPPPAPMADRCWQAGSASSNRVCRIWRVIMTLCCLIPPALGTISLAVMQAANALLVPLAATTPDFCSTVQFLSMMDQVTEQLINAGIEVQYDFVLLLCSKFDANDPSHAMVRQIMEQAFGPALLPIPILESAVISHAALRVMTIYELERPISTPKTHNRDDQVRQHAFLMDVKGEWHLAPAFDLTFSHGPGGEHYMAVMGEGRAIARAHVQPLGIRHGFSEKRIVTILQEVKAVLADWDDFAASCGVAAFRNEIHARLVVTGQLFETN
jgi:hypothetical protein